MFEDNLGNLTKIKIKFNTRTGKLGKMVQVYNPSYVES
jgi:hypothetical protein